jgi:hypothetical protein
MSKVIIYNNGKRVAKTSGAFNVVETKELMRSWIFTFSVVNTDNARKYIQRGAMYKVGGQSFDNKRFTKNSGQNNISTVGAAYHVSRRLNNYTIPAGYSFVGTIPEIIQDMLHVSGADAEFSVGTCADLGTISFSLGNTQDVACLDAIIGLRNAGVEPDFDNFTVLAPVRWGKNRTQPFEFGRDLCDLTIDDDETEDTTTYTVNIAVLMRTSGATPDDYFSVGDTAPIKDSTVNRCCDDRAI